MVRGHTRVLVIGCGIAGAGIARDLAFRGVECVVLDKGDAVSGASGANHGLLHSGARYVVKDFRAARECADESMILKSIASHCIEETGGLFVALPGDDESYISEFEDLCLKTNISFGSLGINDALDIEPSLSKDIIAAYAVNDASVDPFRLTMENLEDARIHGCSFLPYKKVIGFRVSNGRINAVRYTDQISGLESEISADFVINASGAWAGQITSLAGISIPLRCSKGTLLVSASRMTGVVVNRLRKPSDGDIIVPGGTVSVLGTTSSIIDDPDSAYPSPSEADRIIDETSLMVPALASSRYARAYSGVRPLFDKGGGKGGQRNISRGYMLLDHSSEGLENFATISGGKLTTYRLMAEKTADLVCERLGVNEECRTHITPLPGIRSTSWSIPGASAMEHLKSTCKGGVLLCECEMISERIIDEVVDDLLSQGREPNLTEIGLRTRFGKGPCQGGGCSMRIASYLHTRGIYAGNEGIGQAKAMIQSRWKGFRPVVWAESAAQLELQEALQCGTFGIERQ